MKVKYMFDVSSCWTNIYESLSSAQKYMYTMKHQGQTCNNVQLYTLYKYNLHQTPLYQTSTYSRYFSNYSGFLSQSIWYWLMLIYKSLLFDLNTLTWSINRISPAFLVESSFWSTLLANSWPFIPSRLQSTF